METSGFLAFELMHGTKIRVTFNLKNFERKAYRELKTPNEFCFKLMNKVTCPLLEENMVKRTRKKRYS